MMKRLIAWFMVLVGLLLPCAAWAEEPIIINLVENPEADYAFEEGAALLEIVFPRVYSSDCAVLRFGEETMMIDGSTRNPVMVGRVQTALNTIGVDHIDVAYNSHPHDDHIDGFKLIHAFAPLREMILTFPPEGYPRIKGMLRFTAENGILTRQVEHSDVLTLGEHDEVTMTVIQRRQPKLGVNDQSAILMVQYGDRRFLFMGDNEHQAQRYFATYPPECGLNADMLKYPHHGQAPLINEFLEAASPQLCFINGAVDSARQAVAFCEKKGIAYLQGFRGLTRMRTDGHIWVIDYLREIGADRELPYTPPRE